MKKITSISLVIFIAVVGYVYFSSLVSPTVKTPLSTTVLNPPTIDNSATQPSTDTSKNPVLVQNEVAKHSTSGDCCLIVNNSVYDVSSYISLHPGGSRQITSRCGKEVTGIFAQIHSNRAWDLLSKYKIGVLAATNTNTSSSARIDLDTIKNGLMVGNPDAEVISVKPRSDFYIAKVIYNNKLYEVHIDSTGKIIKEEVESDEFDWSLWDSDSDD